MVPLARVVAIMPAFNSKHQILDVLNRMPKLVSKIFVIDDACPQQTGKAVLDNTTDKRVEVVFNDRNLGVGGAVLVGMKKALETDAEIIVKIDSDGQMNPEDIPRLIAPIVDSRADFAKGNRFNSLDDLQEMPKSRLFGNVVLSLMSKLSTGYWSVTDPTNGFLAISRGALENIHLGKLRRGWFFESDILFRLSIIRAVVADVPIRAKYGDERSNLKIRKVVFEFINRHTINFLKRVFYIYYLREWSIVSLELPAGVLLTLGGLAAGINFWSEAAAIGQPATVGQVMLAVLPIILGFQLLLSAISLDIANEPRQPLYVRKTTGF